MENQKKKRCLYQIYAPCDETKCKREHRCTVFTEKQLELRGYIKEHRLCVAFLLFGKCGHANWTRNIKNYNNTHLSMRELRYKISVARSLNKNIGDAAPDHHKNVSEQTECTTKHITELEQSVETYSNLILKLQKEIVQLKDRIDDLNSAKERAEFELQYKKYDVAYVTTQTETHTTHQDTQTQMEQMSISTQTDEEEKKTTCEVQIQTELGNCVDASPDHFEVEVILQRLLSLHIRSVFPSLVGGYTVADLIPKFLCSWQRYCEDINSAYIKEEIARRKSAKNKK